LALRHSLRLKAKRGAFEASRIRSANKKFSLIFFYSLRFAYQQRTDRSANSIGAA
jgi:hypothetical protein